MHATAAAGNVGTASTSSPDGRRVGFTFEPKPYSGILGLLGAGTGGMYQASFRADPGVFETLEGEYDGSAAFRLPLIKYGDSFYTAGISVAYNPLGYRLTTKDGVTYHFGQFDGLKSITDRNDVKLAFARNGITSSLGTSIAFARDGQGRITSITDPNGGTLQYRYDTNGNLLGAKNQVGLEEQYAYESVERPHFLTTVTSVCGCYPSMRLEYDADGRLVRETNGAGDSVTSNYDLPGFRETFTDGLNRATTLTYDPRGNVTAKIDPLGREWRSTYDANDNEISMVDPRGVTTAKEYDARGNVIRATDGGGFVTTAVYDALNLPTAITDARGNTTTMAYDPQGRLVLTTDPTGATTTNTYDSIGRNIVSTDASGRTAQFEYGFEFTTPLRTTYTDGSDSYTAINWLDQPVSNRDSFGNVSLTSYDDEGRSISVTDARGNVTNFGYDNNGRLERVVDALGNITRYEYDQANRKTAEVTGTGRRTWVYDVAGQLIRRVDRNGRETRISYDAAGRLFQESWYPTVGSTTPTDVVTHEYDLSNNITLIRDKDSKVEMNYDNRNLIGVMKDFGSDVTPRSTLTYSYDGTGNVLSVSDQTGTAVTSTYTVRNELSSRAWTLVGGRSIGTTFTYDAAGRVIQQSRTAGGVFAGQTQRSFDAVGNLSRLTHSGPTGQLFADTRYNFDGTVRLIGEQRLDQNVSYGYDADWQLTGANYTGQADENRAYDALGNPAGTTVGPDNRLLADANFNYVYDDEGNQTRKTDRASGEFTDYLFDQRNHLTNVERRSAGGVILSSVGYRYDALDRLIERNVNGELLRTVYDGGNSWADLLATNGVAARYLLGDRVDNLIARWDPADGIAWYLTDRLGTVRQLVNGSGTAILNSIQYSDFGKILSQTNPSAGDRFAYTGREWEAAAGMYYYRARFYDADLGRFISQDPIGFEGGDANLYRYVSNRALQMKDPSGLMATSEDASIKSKSRKKLPPVGICFILINDAGIITSETSTVTKLACSMRVRFVGIAFILRDIVVSPAPPVIYLRVSGTWNGTPFFEYTRPYN